MAAKRGKIKRVYIIYWCLLSYIIAALVWWFIALSKQNLQVTELRIRNISSSGVAYDNEVAAIRQQRKLKAAQYSGEGATFLLLIIAGAVFVFRAVRRELRAGMEQQNFMMAITHELKTPIAIARLNLETLQRRRTDETQQQRLLHNTLEETNRLDNLCNNLLLASQMEGKGYRVTHETIDLRELLADSVEKFRIRYPARQLEENSAENISVNADRFLLQIAVNNLIENALKYSPKETTVRIELERFSGNAELRIIDNGPGIPAEEKERVFRKFYRTGNEATRRAKGTGLGLYLVKKIAREHRAKISIVDNPAGGSIFVLSIPTRPA